MIKTKGVRQFAGVTGTALIGALALLLGYSCLLCVMSGIILIGFAGILPFSLSRS